MSEQTSANNPHQGHRKRLRAQYLSSGGQYLADHQLLELVLFYSVTQRDTNPLAHNLLEYFGSLSGVLSASTEELQQVPGVTERSAALLRLIPALTKRQSQEHSMGLSPHLETREDMRDYVLSLYRKQERRACLVCLDDLGRVLAQRFLDEQKGPSPDINLAVLIQTAAESRARGVLLAIPRLESDHLPTMEDIDLARTCQTALSGISVVLDDVLLICGEKYISMRAIHLLA